MERMVQALFSASRSVFRPGAYGRAKPRRPPDQHPGRKSSGNETGTRSVWGRDRKALTTENIEEITSDMYIGKAMEPPKTVKVKTIWVGQTLPRDKMPAQVWRRTLKNAGARIHSIMQVEQVLHAQFCIEKRTRRRYYVHFDR